jgi:hypothetical protein
MKQLVFESLILLLHVDRVMRLGGLNGLQKALRSQPMRFNPVHGARVRDDLCRAMDLACAFYFKQVLCLQRSAATALLLRRYGHTAEMVIGAQILPLKSHAWVESNGVVVNDRPYIAELYKPLERC